MMTLDIASLSGMIMVTGMTAVSENRRGCLKHELKRGAAVEPGVIEKFVKAAPAGTIRMPVFCSDGAA